MMERKVKRDGGRKRRVVGDSHRGRRMARPPPASFRRLLDNAGDGKPIGTSETPNLSQNEVQVLGRSFDRTG